MARNQATLSRFPEGATHVAAAPEPARRSAPPAPAHFSQPVRQIVLMVSALVLVALGVYFAYPRIAPIFLANPALNGVILLVFVIGVLACFWQVVQLVSSVRWIEAFVGEAPGHESTRAPQLLAPLATLLRARERRREINASSARSILDSVGSRIDEDRDITRYLVNLLIFLGLLGTFYGLAVSVPAVVDTIRSLAPDQGAGGVEVFSRLMNGLEDQLGGMGTAFSSSLLGLAGSLVVGLLELFAGHGQNRFYRELEEWLSTITRFGIAGSDSEGGGEQTAAIAVLDHMAEQMERMQAMFAESDANRAGVDQRLGALADAVERLAARMDSDARDTQALARVAEGQERLLAAIERQTEAAEGAEPDAESRMRLRSIDVQLLRILEDMSAGRQESLADLRSDIAQLTRVIRQASSGTPRDRYEN